MLDLLKKYFELTQRNAGKQKFELLNRNQKFSLVMIHLKLLDPGQIAFETVNNVKRQNLIVDSIEEWDGVREQAQFEGRPVYLNIADEVFLRMNFNRDNDDYRQRIIITRDKTKLLDSVIPLLNVFRSKNPDEQKALLELKYTDEYEKIIVEVHKESTKRILNEYLKKHSQAYKVGLLADIDNKINEQLREIRQLNRQRVRTVTERINFIFSGESLEANNFLTDMEKDVMIKSYKVENQDNNQLIISLLTEPIYIENIDQLNAQKAVEQMLTGTKKDIYLTALKNPETYKIGVGQYKIILYIDAEGIGYDIVPTQHNNNCANRHWTSHNCLGSYSGSVAQATGNMDLRATIFLLLQFLKTITIGDGAGDATLFQSSYVIDEEKSVLYSNLGAHTDGVKETDIVGLYSDDQIRIQGRPRMRAQGRRGLF